MERVVVYGTLKGRVDGELLSVCAVPGFTLYDLGPFPAAVSEEGAWVRGELWEVEDETLRMLDRIEGVPILYKRSRVEARTPDGRLYEAWMYVMESAVHRGNHIGEEWYGRARHYGW